MGYFPTRRYRPPSYAKLRLGFIPGGSAVCEWEREEGDETIVYQIHGTVTDYDPGVTSGPVDRCYPPEGGEVEIEEVYRIDEDGNEVKVENYSFSSEEMREIERLLADNVEPPEPPEPEPYDDYDY